MEKASIAWIIAETEASRARFAAGARKLGMQVACIVIGDEGQAQAIACKGADAVYYTGPIDAKRRVGDYTGTLAQALDEHRPDLVLFESTPDGFLLAGRLAARRGQSTVTNVSAIRNDEALTFERMVFGGTAVQTICPRQAPAIVVAAAHIFPDETIESAGTVETLEYVGGTTGPACTGLREQKTASVDLTDTQRIVCIGRGVSQEEDMPAIRELAELIGAELACTRPVSEVYGLLETERYVGVTGIMFKPQLLVSIGVSGQIQHMVGCNQAGTILAINKDKSARIFPQADLGLAADLRIAVPKIIEGLKAR